jgi:hypothetical protein
MKKASPLFLSLFIFAMLSATMAQKKTVAKPAGKARPKGYVFKRPVPSPKVIVEENWQEFSAAGNKFKVSFPKFPEESQKQRLEYGTSVNIFFYQTYVNGNFYLVNVFEYPKDFLPNRSDMDENYAAWMAQNIIKVDNVLGVKKIGYDRFTGYEFLYRQGPDLVLHRAIVVGMRLYQLVIYMEADDKEVNDKVLERNKEKIDKFFGSFKLLEIPLDYDPTAG